MSSKKLRSLMTISVLTACLGAAPALAQYDPEGGDVWVPPAEQQQPPPQQQPQPPQQQPQPQQQQQQQQQWYQQQQQQEVPPERPPEQRSTSSDDDDGGSDHDSVVGRLAVGFLGLRSLPFATFAEIDGQAPSVPAPTIGMRYWVNDMLGIDAGIGLWVFGGSVSVGTDSAPIDNQWGFVVHAGLPLALAHDGHFKFLIVPEVNLGFAGGTIYGPTQDTDRGVSGFLFEVGARAGAEIHFGFIGVPQLSLQAGIGLYFRYGTAGVGNNRAGSASPTSENVYSFGTSLEGEPWDIFLGNLTALYYF